MGGPEAVFYAGREELLSHGAAPREAEHLLDKSLAVTERVLAECEERHIRILTLQDAEYPERLRRIPDPPAALFVRGRLPAVDESAVIAIVGTRAASPYGLRMAARLGGEITAGGGLVVSGLAEGCDGAAMEAALRAGGQVIGVLGTSIDKVYPARNRHLFDETAARGALISENGPGIRTYASDFKARNRIISGLSLGVIVAEAPVRSGSRVTANYALEQGRDLFAVPVNADGPLAEGFRDLVRLGAVPVGTGSEVLDRYLDEYSPSVPAPPRSRRPAPEPPAPEPPAANPVPSGRGGVRPAPERVKNEIDKPRDIVYIDVSERIAGLPEVQRRILQAMDRPNMHTDEIIEAAGLSAPETLAALTMLQVAGFVVQGPGRRYTRAAGCAG